MRIDIPGKKGDTDLNTLLQALRSIDLSAVLSALLRVAAVLLCLTVHETCHGLAARALGDPTAKQAHRLSLNPLQHIDWLGFACMLLLGFGWAKPVPVDMRYFKNPKRGMALTALAGPVSNLLLAVALLLCGRVLYDFAPYTPFWDGLFSFLLTTAMLSVGLGVFNLIPIPPLDGSKVLFALLPDRAYLTLMRYERYGTLLLYALVFFGALDNFLGSAVYAVYELLVDWIYF